MPIKLKYILKYASECRNNQCIFKNGYQNFTNICKTGENLSPTKMTQHEDAWISIFFRKYLSSKFPRVFRNCYNHSIRASYWTVVHLTHSTIVCCFLALKHSSI
jgi:hypothetical protein